MQLLDLLTDPILRGPALGTMLMAISAALIGVLLFVRKRSLIAETLSHATYPGVTIVAIFAGDNLPLWILVGAFFAALLGYFCVEQLQRRFLVRIDVALTFVLAAFFGVGVTIASVVQNTHTAAYRQIQSYLFGQAATMGDSHILVYSALSLFVIVSLILFFRPLFAATFDRSFAHVIGLGNKRIETLLLILVALCVVIGIRSVGVVLLSAMFIAPATAARQFTDKLLNMFWMAALVGAFSALAGVYLSVKYALPTGPIVAIVAGGVAISSLIISPKRRRARASLQRA
ncbi:MAG: Manganese transport system membrane protein MntC [Chlamydiales bacterium]|nr:Manganese transport system membrane protein MntC [Chlamydiales bacterium]MCH9635532.1 Manganese transport system membrane protein MntC [Chlamydiales bacterium]